MGVVGGGGLRGLGLESGAFRDGLINGGFLP